MKVEFVNFKKQHIEIKKQIDKSVQRVIKNQYFILGNELKDFEKAFADYLGVKYFIGVGSGTDGLILSLLALGVGKGDEVITPVSSFIATSLAISQVGAVPVFVDTDKDSYNIDIDEVKRKISKRTKAILPVHLYGSPCNINELKAIANKYKLFIVEDACQAHGATVDGRKAGTIGDLGVFSFYPSKNLGGYGDGGGIATNSETLYKKLIALRNYGETRKYHHDTFGVNSRLDEVQAAILSVKLKYLDEWNKKRNRLADLYRKYLPPLKMQVIKKGAVSSVHLFVIEHPERDRLKEFLFKKNIHTLIHYPIPIHLQNCYKDLGYKVNDFPNAEKASRHILSLPMYPELTEREIIHISRSIKLFKKQ